ARTFISRLNEIVKLCKNGETEIVIRELKEVIDFKFEQIDLLINAINVNTSLGRPSEHILKKIQTIISSPSEQFAMLVTKEIIPIEIVEELELIQEMGKLKLIVSELEKAKLSRKDFTKAFATLSTSLNKEILGETLLNEIEEGRIDSSDPFLSDAIIISFMHAETVLEGKKKFKISGKNIVLATLASGMILAHFFPVFDFVKNFDSFYIPSTSEGTKNAKSDTSSLEYLQDKNKHPNSNGSTDSVSPETELGQSNEFLDNGTKKETGKTGESMYDENEMQADNSGAEALKNDTMIWEIISGNTPDSYFRLKTFADVSTTGKWKSTAEIRNKITFNEDTRTSKHELVVSSNANLPFGGMTQIPIPYGYRVTDISIVNSSNTRLNVDIDTNIMSDGSLVAKIPSIISQNKSRLEISYERSEEEFYGVDKIEKYRDESKMFPTGIVRIPRIEEQLSPIRNSNISTKDKVSQVMDILGNEITYSVNPKYNEYYKTPSRDSTFAERVLEIGFADCDTHATVGIGILRSMGIPARLATGFANTNSLFNSITGSGRKLAANEMHGFIEYYNRDTNTWEKTEIFPKKIDEYSLAAIPLNSGGDLEINFDIPDTIS
ncbi:MAG: transglutaminase family protein, partial [bacterium]